MRRATLKKKNIRITKHAQHDAITEENRKLRIKGQCWKRAAEEDSHTLRQIWWGTCIISFYYFYYYCFPGQFVVEWLQHLYFRSPAKTPSNAGGYMSMTKLLFVLRFACTNWRAFCIERLFCGYWKLNVQAAPTESASTADDCWCCRRHHSRFMICNNYGRAVLCDRDLFVVFITSSFHYMLFPVRALLVST